MILDKLLKKQSPIKRIRAKDQQQLASERAFNERRFVNSISAGGIASGSGAGSSLDKTEDVFFEPTRVTNRQEFETIYNQSWACKKFINIPVDDMFIRWREFYDMEEKDMELIQAQEKKFEVKRKLSNAMKGGKLYGTALAVLVTQEAPLDRPLNVDRIRPGDLKNILVFNRFDCSVLSRDEDISSPTFGKPTMYQVNLKYSGSFTVHASRVIRFDGQTPIDDDGWNQYDQDWGVSEIVPVITSIKQDSLLASGITHLAQEASIPVVKTADFQDAIEAEVDDDEMTLQERAQNTSILKSIYRTIFMSTDDSFERQEVSFNNLPDLMDRYAKRLSAAADIPATRFWGQSPLGMNATGDSDMINYALSINAMQENKLRTPLDFLDMVLMKDAGSKAEVKYKFRSLIDVSEEDKAKVLETKVKTAVLAAGGPVLTETEARQVLDGDELLGTIEVEDFEIDPDLAPESVPQEETTEEE